MSHKLLFSLIPSCVVTLEYQDLGFQSTCPAYRGDAVL